MIMKQDTDLELAKRILRSLGFKLVSSIETGFTGVGGISLYGINLDDKQRRDIYVYADGRDGKIYAFFDSVKELLASILYTKHFIVDYDHGEYPMIRDNPFSGMTKEQAAIKLDLES